MNDRLFVLGMVQRSAEGPIELRAHYYDAARFAEAGARAPLALVVGRREPECVSRWLEVFESARHRVSVPTQEHAVGCWRLTFEEALDRADRPATRGPFEQMFRELTASLASRERTAVLIAEPLLETPEWSDIEKLLQSLAPSSAATKPATTTQDLEARNRERLIESRRALLQQVGTLSSEQLAAARESITQNASQLANDLRRAGEVFGVRFGKEWRYPKFQFDRRGRARAEVARIRAQLGVDANGWDTLQWFVEPNAHLAGGAPLEVLNTDPARVLEAATQAHRFARD